VERHDYAPFGEEVLGVGCDQAVGRRSGVALRYCGVWASEVRLQFKGKERIGDGVDYFGQGTTPVLQADSLRLTRQC